MYLERSDEQRMLHESAMRFLKGRGRNASWTEVASLGWIAAALSRYGGGLGGNAVDVMPICEAIGASGACVPYFSSVLLPAAILSHADSFEQHGELIDQFVAGRTRVVVAHAEHSLVFCSEAPSTVARAQPQIALTGVKRRVWDALEANAFVVSAVAQGQLGWYLVRAGQRGVQIAPGHEGDTPWATVRLDQSAAVGICAGAAAQRALDRAILLATVGVLAESVGCMTELLRLTREWLATRKQFGQPLAASQVLQHRLVDMFIALEEARSMLNLAAHAHDGMQEKDAQPALHIAKAHIANCARFVGQQAVHLHGAMGLTEEAFVGRAYRRLEALNSAFGGADHHTYAYAGLRAT